MGKFSATTYEKPTPAEKPNPYIEAVKQYTDKGIDTPFKFETTADEYKADKLLIQRAVNAHGFSAREVETNWDEELSGKTPIVSTFLIRPQRKARGENAEANSGD